MENKTLRTDFKLKEISEKGEIAGYGSVFNVKDRGGDVVEEGAFAKSIAEYKSGSKSLPILWQHSPDEPIGVWKSIKEDSHGLYLEGQLAMKTVKGFEARELLEMKAITGLSIGYSIKDAEYDKQKEAYMLKELDLWEVSLVTFPMNQEARIDAVKNILAAGRTPTEREFEQFLLKSGLSKSEAKIIISSGYKKFKNHRDDVEIDRDDQSEEEELLKELTEKFKI